MSFRQRVQLHNFAVTKTQNYGVKFSTVETIPNLNASAAFLSPSLEQLKGQVDSGKVFKEDVDMVPTIIDKSLSYMLWGGDNMMPYNILKLIEDDETLSSCLQFNAEVCYGSGINSSMPSIEELMSKGERVTIND